MRKLVLGLIGLLALSTALAQQTVTKTGYVEYTQKAFDEAAGKKRVLFFWASWCPNCRGADKNITGNLEKIPTDVVIFKTDYDKEAALKKQYGITYQHTFVYVNAKAETIKKWSGGGIEEIIANTK